MREERTRAKIKQSVGRCGQEFVFITNAYSYRSAITRSSLPAGHAGQTEALTATVSASRTPILCVRHGVRRDRKETDRSQNNRDAGERRKHGAEYSREPRLVGEILIDRADIVERQIR